MTASEPEHAGERPLIEEALDLLVYAPVGLLSSSLEDLSPASLPELAERGRGRVGRLLSNAQVVGRLTIAMGRRTVESELRRWRFRAEDPDTGATPARPPAVPAPAPPAPARRSGPAPDLAIPDYEALSASQVVRRLDGLGPSELEALYRHEAATRRRRTILHRVQQLLGREGTPGPNRPLA